MLKKITIVFGLLAGSILAAQSQSDPSSSLSHLSSGNAISGSDLFYDVQVSGVGGVKVTGTQFLNWVFSNVTGNCSASISGVFSCTGGNATGIAAGTNIATSGTGTNVTINTILTPTFTSVSTTLASVTGWLTAAGVNAQTETIAGALIGSTANFSGNVTGTTGNFSGNLTSTTHQITGFLTASGVNLFTETIANTLTMANSTTNSFGILDKADGSLYFQSGISTSGSGAVKIVNVDGGSPRFQVAVITDPNGRLSFGLDASNNPQIGFGLGISGRDTFINRQATGTLGFGTTAQGIDASISAGTMTLGSLTPTGPNCLQETGGVIQATNATCGSGGGGSTVKGGPILPSSEYLGGASGLLFPNFYIPNVNTSGAGALEGIGYIATTTIATATLQFNMPETIPTGNARLRILQMANASSGSVQYTVSDAVTSPSNSLGTVTLNFEGVTSVAQTVADQLIERKILLTVTPTANQIMSVVIGTTSGVAQTITYQPSIVWE